MFATQDDGKVAKNQYVMNYNAIVFNFTVDTQLMRDWIYFITDMPAIWKFLNDY